ncbi:imidazole glycerol phosphate synthase subunit HisH [Pantoea sp. Nvir]|uniref:imidazole glycerol phosphate synthase subunit HisH n=1 Tax=Pantoea sp. Nvir TaxID=2576760 RepID=UPI00135AE3C3|nr:imidazole glycerol phosphate synthase subunit HisH [Pantoea sp. Nvir]MXP66645.1 imidazole glycerol phosphate synthase subunit HisH [Pantoea sp. Nvir]CAJ0991969.1 Imidazole glycerol phosphate synthase subunit HisH [Pantoea sp. Nvir]
MKVVVLDTGCANLLSVKWAVKRLGYSLEVSNDPNVVLHSHKLVVPGVGTAQTAMNQLKQYHLIDVIKTCTQPVLGICLGMQLLGSSSDENNGVLTLGIIETACTLMDTKGLPLPHMGWNQIIEQVGNHRLLRGLDKKSYFYFVHSYAMPVNSSTIATCEYGQSFTAVLQKDNFFGVQFHPERSGKAGALLLKNFLEM